VFISHDTRDADIAEAFAVLLQDASGGVLRSFRSSDRKGTSGIEFGAEWYSAIMDRLKDATDVVALLTAQSLGRPWLLYEAGVAKGRLDTVVFGIALGVPLEQAGIGPFAQFQNSGDDEDSLTKLVLQLIRRNPEADPREEAVRRQVVAFRTTTAEILKRRPRDDSRKITTPELNTGAVAKLFEEVKIMFRQLPEQLEQSIERRLPALDLSERTISIRQDFVGYLWDRLNEAKPGDGRPWMELSHAITPISPRVSRAARALHDAWITGDEGQIEQRSYRLLRTFKEPDWRWSLKTLPEDTSSRLRDLPVMLQQYMSRRYGTGATGLTSIGSDSAGEAETKASK
jgi:hypothetical protein